MLRNLGVIKYSNNPYLLLLLTSNVSLQSYKSYNETQKEGKHYMTSLIKTDGNRVVNVSLEVELIKQGDYIGILLPGIGIIIFWNYRR